MYRSILVPLDGTAFGEHALPPAMAVARRTGARLRLVHVHVPQTSWSALEVMPHLAATPREVVVEHEQTYLDAVVERVARRVSVPVETEIPDGPVARTLAERARAAHVDLVVLATHAHTGVSRLWHHGVAAYLTRHLSVPLLLVHAPDTGADLEREPHFGRVLLPLGGDAYSERVLEHAAGLGGVFGARYTLLEVVAPPVSVGYTLLAQDGHVNEFQLQDRREEALRYLEHAAAALRARGAQVDTEVVASADPASAIADYVERAEGEARVDLVAMETHGLGGATHLFTPSVVEEVVHRSTVPVLVHHGAVSEAARFEESVAGRMGWPARHHSAAG